MKKRISITFLALFLFAGCFNNNVPNVQTQVLKKKISFSEEGVVTKKELTIFEDGTHFFSTPHGKKFLLKSNIVDLSRFEDKNVLVVGETQEGYLSDELPTVFVFSVESLLQDADIRESIFTESEFLFSAPLPGNWQRNVTPDKNLEYGPEGSKPVILISFFSNLSEEGEKIQKELLLGTPVVIGGKSGKRLLKSNGIIDVILPHDEGVKNILFHFTPQKNPNLEKIAFYSMLTGLLWQDANDVIQSESDTSLPQEKIFCGGVAKKLCPTGFRCELTSFDSDSSGLCVDISLLPKDISKLLLKEKEVNNFPDSQFGQSENEVAPKDWKEYKRERFSYSFSIPRSWWWKESGGGENTISHVVFSAEEIIDGNEIISLEIVKNPVTEKSEITQGSQLLITLPRDDSTSFRITGDNIHSHQIRGISSSLSSF